MATLYELTHQVQSVKAMLDADFIDEQTFNDTMESLEGDLETKADGLLAYVANLKAEEQALADEIKRLQAKKKVKSNAQVRLRNYLRDNMEQAEISKIECPLFTITLRKPGQVVEITDEGQIPGIYTTQVVKPDKALIKDALKLGKQVPGCHLEYGKPGLLIR